MKKIFFIFLCYLPAALIAQQYSVLLIPDSLIKNANVVKRYDEITLEIKSPAKAVQREHHVYTILDEKAEYYARITSFYGQFNSINYVNGTLYDASGKVQKHIKKKDMDDYSYADGFSLMNDERYKTANFYTRNFPYTVDYEEEDDINGILHFDQWFPANAAGMSVVYSKYVIIAPKDYVIRFKPINCSAQPVITEDHDKKIYTWEIKNIPAKFTENLGPSWSEIAPHVLIGPSDFEAQGYKGNMATWESYGKFIYDLQKGRDVLPEETKRKVHELTDNLTNPKDKIKVLYEYMQKNTHYISVQLGIGGWQPFDANYVATKRYGDCKALSNYMVALLKEVGITGKTVDIRAGANAASINKDFPSFQFNHEIACVPLNKDTTWLECTSETLPAGYLSSFTANRYAIMIDEKGGTLVHTPKYGLNENEITRKINAAVNEEGNLSAVINTQYKGEEQDRLEQMINGLSKDKMLDQLKTEIELPTFDISKFDYTQQKNILPSINESIDLNANNYAQVSGRRLFINPDIINRSSLKYKQDDERKYDVELNNEYKKTDSIEIKIPAGYQPESVPQDISINNKFGKYTASVKVMPDKIFYYRNMEQYSGRFPAKDYNDLVHFYDVIYKADRNKIVLIKKD